jgi:hypothetical protein
MHRSSLSAVCKGSTTHIFSLLQHLDIVEGLLEFKNQGKKKGVLKSFEGFSHCVNLRSLSMRTDIKSMRSLYVRIYFRVSCDHIFNLLLVQFPLVCD